MVYQTASYFFQLILQLFAFSNLMIELSWIAQLISDNDMNIMYILI